jgi:hypothetical protein
LIVAIQDDILKLEAKWMKILEEVSTLFFNGIWDFTPFSVGFVVNAFVHFMCCECLGEWTSYKQEYKDEDEDEDKEEGGVGVLCMWYLTNHFFFFFLQEIRVSLQAAWMVRLD